MNPLTTFSVRAFMTLMLAFVVPAYAHAGDWEKYVLVCNDGKSLSVITQEGVEEEKLKGFSDDIRLFVRQVNAMMEDGWKPLGGLALGFSACQAMVKK